MSSAAIALEQMPVSSAVAVRNASSVFIGLLRGQGRTPAILRGPLPLVKLLTDNRYFNSFFSRFASGAAREGDARAAKLGGGGGLF